MKPKPRKLAGPGNGPKGSSASPPPVRANLKALSCFGSSCPYVIWHLIEELKGEDDTKEHQKETEVAVELCQNAFMGHMLRREAIRRDRTSNLSGSSLLSSHVTAF